jgi:hypothetical protein
MRQTVLHVSEILGWADEHRDRTGKLPTASSGVVAALIGVYLGMAFIKRYLR